MERHLQKSNFGLLLIRVSLGLLFVWGGLGKLFGILGGPGLEMFSGMVWGSVAIAAIVGTVELIAGTMVTLGFFDRYANLSLATIIIVATFKVHVPNIGAGPMGVIMVLMHVVLLSTLVGLAFVGSGRFAMRRRIAAPVRN